MRSSMPSSQTGPVILWESIGVGGLLYGVLHEKLQKLLKEKVSRANLQKAIHLSLNIAELEKWPVVCLYTDS